MNVPTHLLYSIAIYLVGLLLIGWLAGRKNKNAADYLVAGRSLPLWVAVMTLTATMFGGGMLVARTGWGYRAGPVFFIYALISFINQALLALLIVKFKNFSRYTTVTQFLEDRYHSTFIRSVCAALSMVSLLTFTASQVNALVNILKAMGFPNPKLIALFCMIVIIALTVYGGILAVSITDTVQMFIIIIGVAVLLVTVLTRNGGYGNIVATLQTQEANLPANYLDTFHKDNLGLVFWMMLPGILGALIGQEGYQRLFACKNIREARKCSFIAGILMTLIASTPVIFGMVARIDFPELAANGTHNTALAMVILKYLPGALGGVLLCSILSAILSTGDSMLSSFTSVVVADFWCVFIDKNADMSSKKMLSISRLITLVGGIIALLMSFCFNDILTPILNVGYFVNSVSFVPIVLGVLWKGSNKTGTIAGMAAGLVMCCLGMFANVVIGPIPAEVTSVFVAAIVNIVVSKATSSSNSPVAMEN